MSEEATTRQLWRGQRRILEDLTPRREFGVVGGNGYGKSLLGARFHFDRTILNKDSPYSLIAAPKDDLLKKGPIERLVQVFRDHGLKDTGPYKDYSVVGNPTDIRMRWGHTIMCRSVHKTAVSTLVAVDISHAWLSEAGLCPPSVNTEIAKRLRCPRAVCLQVLKEGTPEGVNHFSERFGSLTPEGFRTVKGYKIPTFSADYAKNRVCLHGVTYDNLALRESGYAEALEEEFSWNKNLFLAYLLGQFVPIYDFRGYDYDPTKHRRDLTIYNDRPLYLSWDFNVTQGRLGGVSWVTGQEFGRDIGFVAENKGSSRTTDEAIGGFISDFQDWKNREVIITGDASGQARDTRGYDDDYAIIKARLSAAGFKHLRFKVPPSNPSVSKRITAVNRGFSDNSLSRLLVGSKCNKLHTSFLQTTIDEKGKIVKPTGQTHTDFADAAGYLVTLLRPIRERGEFSNYDLAMV